MAHIDECEASHGVVAEEPPLESFAVLRFLGIEAKCLNYSGLRLLEELSVGDDARVFQLAAAAFGLFKYFS